MPYRMYMLVYSLPIRKVSMFISASNVLVMVRSVKDGLFCFYLFFSSQITFFQCHFLLKPIVWYIKEVKINCFLLNCVITAPSCREKNDISP